MIAFAIVFLTGYNFAVPEYRWAVAYQPVHAVFLDNLGVAALITLAGLPRGLVKRSDAVVYAGLIASLAILGLISPALNPTRPEDVGQAIRLMLFAAYTLHAVRWTQIAGDTFVLRTLLLGIAVAGAINIYMSITDPYLRIGYLPALRSRNGAGGPLGLGVALAAWLFMIRRTRFDTMVAYAAALIGLGAGIISFSKTSMLIGACGLGAWLVVIAGGMTRRAFRNTLIVAGAWAVAGTAYVRQSEQLSDLFSSFQYSLGIKFARAALSLNDGASTQWRYQYFWGVAEIVSKHPLAGVGSSGFYDAITHTQPFEAGLMGEEDPQARTQGGANPHNSFLFYASANGIPGLLISVALFAGFLVILWRRLGPYGRTGRGVWFCIAFGYFIFGMTLPSLFNTMVLFMPAAVAIGLARRAPTGAPTGVPGRRDTASALITAPDLA